MPVLGRQNGSTPQDNILRDVDLDIAITSSDIGRFTFYNPTSSKFELCSGNTSSHAKQLSTNMFGMLKAVTGNKGDIQIAGPTEYSGALAGQIYYLETDGTNRVGVPDTGYWIRLGYTVRPNVLIIDTNVQKVDTLLGVFDSKMALEGMHNAEFCITSLAIINNTVDTDENGIYQAKQTGTSPDVFEWVRILNSAPENKYMYQFMNSFRRIV